MPIPAKPTITPPPSPLPTRGENPTTFSNNINALVAWYPDLTDNLSDSVDWMDLVFTEVESEATAASDSATDAQTAETGAVAAKNEAQTIQESVTSNVNFKGNWADQTGSAAPPYSVLHDNTYWQLLVSVADITTSEPSSANSDWAVAQGSSMIGDIKAWPQDENPAGWLELDGTIYTQAAYPDLAARFPAWQRLFDTLVPGTPTLGGSPRSVTADASRAYAGYATSPYFSAIERSDWSVVAGTPTFAGTVNGLSSDANNVYAAVAASPYFQAMDKGTLGFVAGTPTLTATSGNCVAQDSSRVYIGHTGGDGLTVLEKSDWSIVAGTPTTSDTVNSIFVDDDYIYLGTVSSGDGLEVYDKATFTRVDLGLSFGATINGVAADANYIFLAAQSAPAFRVVSKRNWLEVPGIAQPATVGRSLTMDSDYVYFGGNPQDNNAPVIYDKTSLTPVGGVASITASSIVGLYVDSDHLIAVDVVTPYFSVVGAGADATEFRLPSSRPSVGGTKLMVRAE